MRAGLNQYPPMAGVAALREAVAAKMEALYGARYDPGEEITVTAGATEAILSSILAVVHPGDEVIVLEPCYDSYVPNIELAGGRAVPVPLMPGTFRPDFERLAAALTPRTRALLVNTPHNPSATAWTAAEMERLAALLRPTDVILISRRGLRAHGVRRAAPRERGAPSGTGRAQPRSCRASARPITSPAGRSAMSRRRQR